MERLRQTQNWGQLNEKMTKYRRKYFSSGSAWEYLIKAETLMLAIPQILAAEDYAYDACPAISWLPTPAVTEDLVQEILVYLKKATGFETTSLMSTVSVQQAHVWIAYLNFAMWKPKQAITTLDETAVSPPGSQLHLGLSAATVFLMHRTIKAWAIQKHSNVQDSLVALEDTFRYLSGVSFSQDNVDHFPLHEKQMLETWMDSALFTYSMSLFSCNQIQKAVQVSQFYVTLTSQFTGMSSLRKRSSVLTQLVQALFAQLPPQPLTLLPVFRSFHDLPRLSKEEQECVNEIRKLLPVYEKVLIAIFPFPEGGDTSGLKQSRYLRVQSVYDYYFQVDMPTHRFFDESLGDYIDRKYKLIEVLYGGTKHTFQSLRLLRYISHTFLTLIHINYDNMPHVERLEAASAAERYVYMWEKEYERLVDEKCKFLMDQPTNTPATTKARFADTEDVRQSKEDIIASRQSLNDQKRKEELTATVVIPSVQRETIADFASVIVTAIRIMMTVFKGDAEKLRMAAVYGELAFTMVRQHGQESPHYNELMRTMYQWLAIVYGELGLEVVSASERRAYQNDALSMLKRARNLGRLDANLAYQFAVQHAESGDFGSAMDMLNKAITIDPKCPQFYNLLALLLTSRNKYEKALQICQEGWRICLQRLSPDSKSLTTEADVTEVEQKINWDMLDPNLKKEMISLRFTQLAIEYQIYGASGTLKSLQRLFRTLRRIAGVPVIFEEKSGSIPMERRQSGDFPLREKRASNASATNVATLNVPLRQANGIPKSGSTSTLNYNHQFYVFDMQITLWLLTASLYRDIALFEKATSSVKEAQTLLESLCKAEARVYGNSSRLFEDNPRTSYTSLNGTHHRRKTIGAWNMADSKLRRISADIAFEKAMIAYHSHRQSHKPKTESKYQKYLSPVARVEVERGVEQRRQERQVQLQHSNSNSSLGSFQSNGSTNELSSEEKSDLPSQSTDFSQTALSNGVTFRSQSDVTDQKMEDIIEEFLNVLHFDPHHLPSLTQLGMLYQRRGDLAMAEHWLSRACSHTKHRGVDGGLPGVYGGATSQWGWLCWKAFGEVLNDTGRLDEARKSLLFSLDLRHLQSVRGYEVLPRFQYDYDKHFE
ncbi:hypothetical protein EDD86DRAFT_204972 [Gorgonomyces haynaldii]|nr:hypothetical protein EDD86DRAFT_204972 [Gorgonomyces haynaldii]